MAYIRLLALLTEQAWQAQPREARELLSLAIQLIDIYEGKKQ